MNVYNIEIKFRSVRYKIFNIMLFTLHFLSVELILAVFCTKFLAAKKHDEILLKTTSYDGF